MLGKVSEREARVQISKHFPWCPFCCFKNLETEVESDRMYDHITCVNCGAKWEVKIQDKLRSAKLVSTSIDWKGKDLLEKEMDPRFWQDKAWLCILTRKTPESKS